MPDRYFFIVNPKSGASAYAAPIRHFRDYLRGKGAQVDLELTRSLAHASELATHASQGGYKALVVAGGDGTVRTVADAMAGSSLPILIIPTGTENLLAGELGLDGSMATNIAAIEHGNIRRLDLASANGQHFIAVAGMGFDGEVIRRLNKFRSGHITHMDYLWPITRTFWEYNFPTIRVEADGELLCDEPGLVFVGNISRYAVQLQIFYDADCSDGLMDVTIYKCSKRRELILHSLSTILRCSHRNPRVVRRKCRQIHISSPDRGVPVQLDGDPGPNLPLNIEVLSAAAQVLTPPHAAGSKYSTPVRYYHLRKWLSR